MTAFLECAPHAAAVYRSPPPVKSPSRMCGIARAIPSLLPYPCTLPCTTTKGPPTDARLLRTPSPLTSTPTPTPTPAQRKQLTFVLQERNLDELTRIATSVSDPASPSYGQHLSLAELSALTRPAEHHIRLVRDFLQGTLQSTHKADADGGSGTGTGTGSPIAGGGGAEMNPIGTCSIEEAGHNGAVLVARCPIAAAEALLATAFLPVYHIATGLSHLRGGDAHLPASVRMAVQAIFGLHDLPLITPKRPGSSGGSSSGSSGGGSSGGSGGGGGGSGGVPDLARGNPGTRGVQFEPAKDPRCPGCIGVTPALFRDTYGVPFKSKHPSALGNKRAIASFLTQVRV